jgi:hypothetical protein
VQVLPSDLLIRIRYRTRIAALECGCCGRREEMFARGIISQHCPIPSIYGFLIAILLMVFTVMAEKHCLQH